MKKIALGLALAALTATAASAGALVDPVMEPQVIVEAASATSFPHDILPPLLFILFAVPMIALW